MSNLLNAESILRAVTQIFVLSADDLYNRDELTRTQISIGQHQGADEQQQKQEIGGTTRPFHLGLSFQTCRQPEGHQWPA